jgi:hypothetical protein
VQPSRHARYFGCKNTRFEPKSRRRGIFIVVKQNGRLKSGTKLVGQSSAVFGRLQAKCNRPARMTSSVRRATFEVPPSFFFPVHVSTQLRWRDLTYSPAPLFAVIRNTGVDGFLLASSSKMPRVQLVLLGNVYAEAFPIKASDKQEHNCETIYACDAGFALKMPLKLSRY